MSVFDKSTLPQEFYDMVSKALLTPPPDPSPWTVMYIMFNLAKSGFDMSYFNSGKREPMYPKDGASHRKWKKHESRMKRYRRRVVVHESGHHNKWFSEKAFNDAWEEVRVKDKKK